MRIFEIPYILHPFSILFIGKNLSARNAISRPLDQPVLIQPLQRLRLAAPVPALGRIHPPPRLARIAADRFPRRVQRNRSITPPGSINLSEPPGLIRFRYRNLRIVPNHILRPGIKEDQILDIAIPLAAKILGIALDAGYIITEIPLPKNLIHQNLHIMPDFIVNMQIDRPLMRQQLPQQHQPFPQKSQKLIPQQIISISQFVIPAAADRAGPIRANAKPPISGKGRINIDQRNLPVIFFRQSLQNRKIFAINQFTPRPIGKFNIHIRSKNSPNRPKINSPSPYYPGPTPTTARSQSPANKC